MNFLYFSYDYTGRHANIVHVILVVISRSHQLFSHVDVDV